MSRAAQLRSILESSLEQRIPSAFSPQTRAELSTLATGIPELDALLEGGLPVGAITEIIGPASSGRITCTNSFLRQVIGAGHVCAWVDASDSFDPESAAGSGVDLDRLLWVRCGSGTAEDRSSISGPAYSSPSRSPRNAAQAMPSGGSHPRHEAIGLSEALNTLLSRAPLPPRRRQIGTPGATNRSLDITSRAEQIATDRLPSRRGSYLLQPKQRSTPSVTTERAAPALASPPACAGPFQGAAKPWSRLDQALRATDLLMQAGGFGALVLDLGSIKPQFANRVPLATWFRFRAAAERSRTAFLLLTQHPCAQSSAEVVLRTSLSLPQAGTVLNSIPFTVERLRQRFTPSATSNVLSMRKPPQRASTAHWQAHASWFAGDR